MKYLFLILPNFSRHKLRTALSLLSIVVAFVLFGYLAAIRRGFEFGAQLAGADRIIVRHSASLTRVLPRVYQERILEVGGVSAVTHSTFFVGVYKSPLHVFPQFAVDPAGFLDLRRDFILPPEQKSAWLRTRTGAVVGRATAERFGLEIGDRIPIRSRVWLPKSGGELWIFDVVGIYDGAHRETDVSHFLFRYDYFDAMRRHGTGMVSAFLVRVANPEDAPTVATAIDRLFENSPHPTRSESEAALLRGMASQVGDVGFIVIAILAVVFFTMLLIVGNTVAESVRERWREFGVLKAIGFTNEQVLSLVLTESCLIAVTGGTAGLFLGWLAVSAHNPLRGVLPAFVLSAEALATGAGFVLLLGIISGLIPAVQAMRLNAVDALKVE